MENNQKNTQNSDVTIDLLHIAKSLWRRAWAIVLITIICGAAAFGYTKLFIKPQYSSSAMFYVNNGMSFGGINISQLNAAQSLVDTYEVLLESRDTMLKIKNEANVNESWRQLRGMISAEGVNETEVFKITVISDSPEKSEQIAKAVTTVFPGIVAEIIDGCSVELVDSPEPASFNTSPISPNVSKNVAIGAVIGFIAACVLLAILALLDDTIHDEDYITQNYDLPILAKIPNLVFENKADYYYKKNYKYRDKYRYKSTSEYADAIEKAEKNTGKEAK